MGVDLPSGGHRIERLARARRGYKGYNLSCAADGISDIHARSYEHSRTISARI